MTLYPWGGEFVYGNPESPVAVVTLAEDMRFLEDKVAIYGNMKTENLGIEKVVANVVSNPRIRFLIVAGEEIRGHRAGGTLVELHRAGIDENDRVRGAPGAVPYIENIGPDAVERFQRQVELVDMIGETDADRVMAEVESCISRNPGSFGEPFIAIRIEERKRARPLGLAGSISLYCDFMIDYTGKVTGPAGGEE